MMTAEQIAARHNASIGHNSKRAADDRIRSFVERIERLETEKKALADDIRDVYAEAKGNSFNVKALRDILRMRKQNPDRRREHEAVVETYLAALGMLS